MTVCSKKIFYDGFVEVPGVWIKFSVYAEIFYLNQFEYAEFDDVHFLFFRPDIPLSGEFGPKSQNSPFKLKFRTS